jgi:hypothetical protein
MPAATIVRADHPDYFRWHAAAARGKATVLGYSYTPDGVRQMAVTPWVQRMKTNPLKPGEKIAITFGKKFFTDILKEYNDLVSRCWFREAIQNSVDAKARHIDIKTETLADGRFMVTVTDDGSGMSEHILYNKFLVPAESGKDGDPDATGGFGDAKRLLFWPWCQYTVYTNGSDGPLAVQGEGLDVRALEGIAAQGRGTMIQVIMPAEQHVEPVDAVWFIQRCYLPRVSFRVNGVDVEADLRVGKEIESTDMSDDLDLHYSPRSALNAFIIRQKGLVMFEVPVNPGIVKGAIIGELKKPSTEVLAKDRNELKRYAWRPQSFAQELAQDRMSKLKPKKTQKERMRYKGDTTFKAAVADTTGRIYDALARHFDDLKNKKLADSIASEMEALVSTVAPRAEDDGKTFLPTPGMAKIIIAGLGDTLQAEAAAKQLTWAADFYINNDTEDYRIPKWIRPEGMEVKPRKLARLWLEFCRMILIRLGYSEEFGIGWIFSENNSEENGYTMAQFVREEGMSWLLLNPFVAGKLKTIKNGKEVDGDTYSLRDPHHLNTVFALALHECTHLVNGISYHNEEFSSALTRNIALVLPSSRLMLAIRDAVTARQEYA